MHTKRSVALLNGIIIPSFIWWCSEHNFNMLCHLVCHFVTAFSASPLHTWLVFSYDKFAVVEDFVETSDNTTGFSPAGSASLPGRKGRQELTPA
jgi:hypothetical protein